MSVLPYAEPVNIPQYINSVVHLQTIDENTLANDSNSRRNYTGNFKNIVYSGRQQRWNNLYVGEAKLCILIMDVFPNASRDTLVDDLSLSLNF